MGMDETFVRIKRSVLHDSLWLSRREKTIWEAFFDILLTVNNERKSVFFNGKEFTCGKYQSLKSITTWAGRWYCKKDRANYYLRKLKKMGYIRIENMKYSTRITVLEAQRFYYLGSDGYSESVNGFTTGKKKKSQRITDSKPENSSEVVNGKKNNFSTKQVTNIAYTGEKLKESSSLGSSLNSSLNELEKEKIMLEFEENEKKNWEKEKKNSKEKWNILELEDFFKNISLPTEPVKLNQCSTITDIELFVNSHLPIVKSHDGNRAYKPYFERLEALKDVLTKN